VSLSTDFARSPPELVGGALCVDFANTVGYRGRPSAPQDRLNHYSDLVHWSFHAGALTDARRRQLLRAEKQRPDSAARVLGEAIELREALARLLLGERREEDLASVNRLLARAPSRTRLVRTAEGWDWATTGGEPLEEPLWPVLWSGTDLLTSEQRRWVRACGDAECSWLFLDTSRGHRRRWCSMETCGNRAKARRHYARQQRMA
jgi:predicted RNA-binding Zn ribbon-like protein